MSEQIKPALSAEEWEAVQQNGAGTLTGGYDLDYSVIVTTHPNGFGAIIGRDSRHRTLDAHGAAAALLYGQPFGFTREDVKGLRGAIKRLEAEPEPYNLGREIELRSLADRIKVLLPPETP